MLTCEQANQALDALCALEEGLTNWEVGFVDDMAAKRRQHREALKNQHDDVADAHWWANRSSGELTKLEQVFEERA